MKRNILLLLLITTAITLYSQNRIVFAYDEAGNRISREMKTVILPNRAPAAADTTGNVAREILFGYTIKVYPNPTQGQLTIEIEDYDVDTPLDLAVFDRNGQPLERRKVTDSMIYLDLTRYPSATWYVVAFMLNGERRDFKIIKL